MKLLPLIWIFFYCAATMLAQPSATESSKTFRIFNTINELNDLLFDLNGTATKVIATPAGLSQPYPCPTTKLITFYRLVPTGAEPTSKPIKEIVAEVVIPAEFSKSILLFATPTGSAVKPQLIVAEDTSDHTSGTFRLLNFSAFPSAININKNTGFSKQKESTLLRFEAGTSTIQVAVEIGQRWTSVTNVERIMANNLRGFCFLLDGPPASPNELPINCYIIFDYIKKDPTKQNLK